MNIEVSDKSLQWGALDLALFGITTNWHDQSLNKPLAFGLSTDQDYLWFVACHDSPATLHPHSRPGAFQKDLWKYDVAECFICDPSTGRYLELNLSPNGAWWSAFFTAPRQRENEVDAPLEGVATYADLSPNGGWMAAMAIPLQLLRDELNFGDDTTMNVTCILHSPDQEFCSATKLTCAEPDFHRPAEFKKITFFKQ